MISNLLFKWLGRVNQPVVEEVKFKLDETLEILSDGGNFTEDECIELLKEFITHKEVDNGKKKK
jgi:hypothetical protein